MARKTKNAPSRSPSENRLCRFEFEYKGPGKVCLAGSFNDWQPGITPMLAFDNGRWLKEISLPPGRYEYRFVVNGEWADDPNANEVAPNPHGGFNAVRIVL